MKEGEMKNKQWQSKRHIWNLRRTNKERQKKNGIETVRTKAIV